MNATAELLRRVLAPLNRKLQLMVTRGSVKLSDDSAEVQALQVSGLKGETHDRVQRYQQYGFSSRPLKGAKAILLALFGSRSKLLALTVEDGRYRKNGLEEGEVAMYTDEGDYIVMKRGRIIEVYAGAAVNVTALESATIASPDVTVVASTKVLLDTPLVHATTNLQVDGNINAGGDIAADGDVSDGTSSMQGMRDIYDGHDAHPPSGNGQGMS